MKLVIPEEKITNYDKLFRQFVYVKAFDKITKSEKLSKAKKQIITLNLYALSAAAYESLYMYSKTTLTKVPSQYIELNKCVESMFSTKEYKDRETVTYYLVLEKHLCDIFGLSSHESISSLYLLPHIKHDATEREKVRMTLSKIRTDLHKGAIMCALLEFLTPYITEVFRKFNHDNAYVDLHDKIQTRYGYIVLDTIVKRKHHKDIKEIADLFNVLLKKIAKEIQ